MLLFYLLLTLFASGSSANICYGKRYTLPLPLFPVFYKGSITYTPKNGQGKVVVNNSQSLDPRFIISHGQINMIDLTEEDDGGTLTSDSQFYKHIQLGVMACREPEIKPYGEYISWKIPNEAEYLEFSEYRPKDPVKPVVLWNRTDLSLGRGRVRKDRYEIENLKQQDNGYYRFRGSKNQLLKWQQLQVIEHRQNYESEEGDYVYITYPRTFTPSEVQFALKRTKERHTIKADSRVEITDEYLGIEDVRTDEAGTYYFLDDQMNIVLQVDLIVNSVEPPNWVNIVMIAVSITVIVLCCWSMKRCCCEKSSNKRNNSDDQTEAAAPNVYYHGTTQPSPPAAPLLHREPLGPPQYPTQPTHPPPYSYQPTTTFSDPPPTYNSVLTEMKSPSPAQVSASGEFGTSSSTNYNFISSDSEPAFEVTLPSASPLNAETSISAEYTSDKLNFI